MAITETARRNHDELFPDRISTLAQTDPELIERFDNFAFDEVLADSDLDTRTRLMVRVFDFLHAANDVLAERGVQLNALRDLDQVAPADRNERAGS
jgi:4-carboxymuconolactone decarboxylase